MSAIDTNQINDYCANIAIDHNYRCDTVMKAVLQAPRQSVNHQYVNCTRDHMELMLARISKTSPGNNNIPYWVYHDCASGLSEVVTRIVNVSVYRGIVHGILR